MSEDGTDGMTPVPSSRIEPENPDDQSMQPPPPSPDRDPCSVLLACFPLPGEIWTHLCASGNHYRHCDV